MRFIVTISVVLFVLSSCQKRKQEQVVAAVSETPIPSTPIPTLSTTIPLTPSIVASPTLGLEIGDIAYDLNLANTDSVPISLASLRGKLVLIDFWASWCRPCKYENDRLRKVYTTYKDANFKKGNGFEIYSISTDAKRKNWLDCLKAENYNWPNNVYDYGNGASWRYDVKFIPQNFLIDGNGIIIAKNLRDTLVEKTLNGLLSN